MQELTTIEERRALPAIVRVGERRPKIGVFP